MDSGRARQLLEAERERLDRWYDELLAEQVTDRSDPGAGTEQSTIDQHLADQASDLEAQERVASLIATAHEARDELEDAFRRLEQGRYGRCLSCDEPIPDERLEAVPATRFCREHQGFWEGEPRGLRAPGGPRSGESGAGLDALMRELAAHHGDLPVGDEDLSSGPEQAAMHVDTSLRGPIRDSSSKRRDG